MKHKNWTYEEIELLKKEYPNKYNKELMKLFNRGIGGISKQASSLGLKKSEHFWIEEKKRMSNRLKLNNPTTKYGAWNKGLTKEDPRVMKYIQPRIGMKCSWVIKRNLESNPMKNLEVIEKNRQKQLENYKSGKVKAWCEGLTKETDERLKRISEKYTGRELGEEWKKNIKKTHWSKSPEKDKIIEKTLKTREKYWDTICQKISKTNKEAWKDPNSIFNSPEFRKKISLATSMENNPMWKGGKSFEPYGIDFNREIRKFIKERDGCCLLCHISFEDLRLLRRRVHIHHINYDKNCNIQQNLISLCNSCHSKTNVNRSHWTNFFQSLLLERYKYKYSENGEIILEIKNEI